ncbi:MAG: sulfite exporter TauE/SafE family protein [Verrucomicrobiaceae bacterium]|nr:sulfite exporter TauE/SafE family protein [Verrucomicrobiaceae bacterium]
MPVIDTSAAAFLAGLVTSLHCIGMCGPLSCSWALGRTAGAPVRPRRFIIDTSLYHASRLVSYGLVGTLAGLIGVVPLRWFQHGGGVLLPWLLVLAFALVGLGIETWFPKPAFLSKPVVKLRAAAMKLGGSLRAALLGLATPLLPCGPLYMMFTLAMANGSPARGAEFTVAFGLGTLPLLWLAQTQLHWLGGRLQPATLRKVQRGLALVAAVIMAWRLRGTLSGDEAPPCCCH